MKKQKGKTQNKKLAPLIRASQENRHEEVIPLARALVKDSDPEVAYSAKRLLALALFHTKVYEESSALWVELFKDSDNPNDWLSVVTTLLMAKKFDEADRYFQPALDKLNAYTEQLTAKGTGWRQGDVTGFYLLFYYAQAAADVGAPERALPKIREMSKIYASAGITDDHMLIVRGMIPLGDFCELVKKVYPPTRQDPLWADVFYELLTELDDDGKSTLQTLRQSLTDSDRR